MIGRLAMIFRMRRGPFAALVFAVLLGVVALHALGQDKIDDKAPIPPENNKRALDAAKFRIPTDRAMFKGSKDPKTGVIRGGIEDNRPLASEKQNPDEYQAITEVMLHASQFTGADLAEVARRDLTPDDLTYSARFQFRLDLVRFEGKLVKARRLQPTKSLEDAGFKQMFEAWLVPEDESPGYPLALLFSQWPEGFASLPEIPEGQQAGPSAALDKWVAFGGYSFKLMTYPGPTADPKNPTGPDWNKSPLLIGRSIVPMNEPPAKIALDRGLRAYDEIRDKTRMNQNPDFWEEFTAWNRIVMHARRFSAEQLEAAAARTVTFGDLFQNPKDHRLDLVLMEGRLMRLKQVKSPDPVAKAGLEFCYEAWVIPDNEPRGNPVCFILVDPPAGIAPKESMDVAVKVAGYSFKLFRYESGEQDKDDAKKNVDKYAPMLIGRTATVKPPPTDSTTAWWTEGFVPAVVGGVILLGGAALTLGWWFRRGDRVAQAEIEANRHKNPF